MKSGIRLLGTLLLAVAAWGCVAATDQGQPPAAGLAALSSFKIATAITAKDGGSVFIRGALGDATPVNLRLDNAIKSETKGQLFIKLGAPEPQTTAEMRRPTATEAAALVPVLEQAAAAGQANVDADDVREVVAALKQIK